MTSHTASRIAAISGILAVALGAFGAHGLKDILAANDTAAIWDKAVFYHFIHTVVILILARSAQSVAKGPILAFLIGICIFSGSLYLLSVTGVRWLGAITPIGGIAFIVGWVLLAVKPGR